MRLESADEHASLAEAVGVVVDTDQTFGRDPRRPNLEDDVAVVPHAAGVYERCASFFVGVSWKLRGESSAVLDEYFFVAFFQEQRSILRCHCDSTFS